MFCTSCGSKVNESHKFCGNCGANIKVLETMPAYSTAVNEIILSPLPPDLLEFPLSITDVEAEGPDDEGNLRVTVKYSVTNEINEDWEHLSTRAQLLTASGLIVDETSDSLKQSVSAGEEVDLETSFWSVKANMLGDNPEKAHIVLSVIASVFGQQKLGEVSIPGEPWSIVPIKTAEIEGIVKLVSGSLWKTEPNDDGDSYVQIKALVQNLTAKHLPEVRITGEVNDNRGKEIADASGYDEVRSGCLATIEGSNYVNDKKLLAGAKVNLVIRAFWPIVASMTQRSGMSLIHTGQDSTEDRTVFQCREIVYTIITYTPEEYSKVDFFSEIVNWQKELKSNGIAKPILAGSPFDDEDGHLDLCTSGTEKPDEATIYVVLYYFNEDACYSISDDANSKDWTVNVDSLLTEFDIACAMNFLTFGDREEYFECDSSSDKSEEKIAIFKGKDDITKQIIAKQVMPTNFANEAEKPINNPDNRIVYADKMMSISLCEVIRDDGFGDEDILLGYLQGMASPPFLCFENKETGDDLGFVCVFGDEERMKDYPGIPLTGAITIDEYIDHVLTPDFQKASGIKPDHNYLSELIRAAINEDPSDFEFENDISLTMLGGEFGIFDGHALADHIGKLGIWVETREEIDIAYNADTNTLNIENKLIDISVIPEEYFNMTGIMSAALIDYKFR
jgi:hypothetical protein